MVSKDDLLEGIAKDGSMDYAEWPSLLERVLSRLEHITYNDFPVPSIPLPEPLPHPIGDDPSIAKEDRPSSHGSQSSRKENVLTGSPSVRQSAQVLQSTTPQLPFRPISDSSIPSPPGTLPPQLISLLTSIQSTLKTSFSVAPPHTAQRLAELILRPTLHYRTLPSYLRALDRVISVSSPASIFPLPSITSPSTTSNGRLLNGYTTPDPSDSPNDDFVGGAELTPIPWLIESTSLSYLSPDRPNTSDLRTESTSLIDGPNGAGSLETVTVTINGIASAGREELLRQDDDVGTAPITSQSIYGSAVARNSSLTTLREDSASEEADEHIYARGPHLIGMEDMGPQASGSRGFDIEAALGRKGEGENMTDNARTGKEDIDGDGDTVVADAEGEPLDDAGKFDPVGINTIAEKGDQTAS